MTTQNNQNDYLFNAQLFEDMQNMANEVNKLATANPSEILPTNTSKVLAKSFNGFASVPGAKNYCGQAACASIIKAWGKHGNLSDEALAQQIYSKFPPDIFGGACGTSPGRIVEILKAYGLKATYAQVATWLPGGFLNPLNQIAWQHHRAHVMDKWVKAGYPVIALVDAGAIDGPWFQPHWVPVVSADAANATIANSLGSNVYKDKKMQIDKFHEAWEVRFLPGLNFVSLLIQP